MKVGNKFVAIEVKTSFPLGGQALLRLAGQIRTYLLGTNAAVPGAAAEVIVVTEESVLALEASYLAVESQIAGGTLSGVLNGTTQLLNALRAILIGL